MLADGEDPQFDAVVELPAVNGLDRIFVHVIPDISQMEAELPNIQKPKLITLSQINGKQLDEAVLCRPQSLLDTVAAATNLGFLGELQIHLLYGIFKKCVVSGRSHISDHMMESIEDQELRCSVYFTVLHAE